MQANKLIQLTIVAALGLIMPLALIFALNPGVAFAQGCDYQIEVLNDIPIAYWRLGDTVGTTAINTGTLGSAVNGTYESGVLLGVNGLIVGESDAAASFDGVNDRTTIPNNDAINTNGPYLARTIELWFRANDLTGQQVLFEEGGEINGLNIFLDGDRLFGGTWINNSGNWISTTVTANTVYHAVLVFDGNGPTLTGYLNGVNFEQATSVTSVLTHAGGIGIGAINDNTRFSNGAPVIAISGAHFSGVIDDVALYSTALSPTRIQAHYFACLPVDLDLSKSISPTSPVDPGETVTYTLTFSNAGPGLATSVVITDLMPVSLTVQSVVSSGLAITDTDVNPGFVWNVQDLFPNQRGVITITGELSSVLPAGTFTNTAIITTTTVETNADNNVGEAGVTISNVAPVANNANLSTPEDTPLNDVLSASDANGNTLTYSIVTTPSTGTLTLTSPSSSGFVYTPSLNFSGNVTFSYKANDELLDSNTATVTVTVTAVNDLPTISDIPNQTVVVSEKMVIGPLGFTIGDAETAVNDLILAGESSNPTLVPNTNIIFGGSGANRIVTITPTVSLTGTALIIVTVDDGTDTVSDTFTVMVEGAPPNYSYLPLIVKDN